MHNEAIGSVPQTWCTKRPLAEFVEVTFPEPELATGGEVKAQHDDEEPQVWFTLTAQDEEEKEPLPIGNNTILDVNKTSPGGINRQVRTPGGALVRGKGGPRKLGGAELRIVRHLHTGNGTSVRDEAIHYIDGKETPWVGEGLLAHQVYAGPEEFWVRAWRFESVGA